MDRINGGKAVARITFHFFYKTILQTGSNYLMSSHICCIPQTEAEEAFAHRLDLTSDPMKILQMEDSFIYHVHNLIIHVITILIL